VARIDEYLSTMAALGGRSLVFTSGRRAALHLPSGDRYSNQVTSHVELVALIEEIVPPSSRAALRNGTETRFRYDHGGCAYSVAVDPSIDGWKATFEPLRGGRIPAAGGSPEAGGDRVPPVLATEREAPRPPPEPLREPLLESPALVSGAGGRILDRLLLQMEKLRASDLHLSTGAPPYLRVNGTMKPLVGFPPLDENALLEALLQIAPEPIRAEFAEKNDSDFCYEIPGVARFRVNLFRDRCGPGAVFRLIPYKILKPQELGLPASVLDLCHLNRGLVLVTGPTGCGKSTTLASFIDYINENRSDHIITIEDPIEFVYQSKRCLVNQREVRVHTRSFKDALRAALREDPDIVLVGEMRDLETVSIALETAETGHLVFGTLHTTSAPGTVDRLIDQFPADQQEQVRQMLADTLRGVICQTLCETTTGGRVAAFEILIGTAAVANLIREGKTFQIFSLMQTGRAAGMMTLTDSLLEHVRSGLVDPRVAYLKAVNKAEFKSLLAREGYQLSGDAAA
jgi:twitching motility protein PilT